MMYSNKLVAVIKVNGRVLRETKDTVYIPFGSQYTIQLKNLHNRKAVVSIDIDGDDVVDDSQYVINAGQTVEIEGFLKGNSIANKFKFIEKTSEISDFRGDNMEDGLIRIKWQYEFEWPKYQASYGGNRGLNTKLGSSGQPPYQGPTYGTSVNYCSSNIGATCDINNTDMGNITTYNDAPVTDNGITARGGQSDQSFNDVTVGVLECTVYEMIIQLKGETRTGYVEAPILTKTKLQCENCGRKWPSRIEFCGGCGTSLR